MDSKIPVFQFPTDSVTDSALHRATSRVIASHQFVLGNEVGAFEAEFAAYCGAADCIGVANGTDAIELTLRGIGIGPGSRVATVANAGFYTSAALASIGALPVYIDVDERSLTMSADALAVQIAGLSAVVVTHLYGLLAPIDDIVTLSATHGVPVIEDCAQAHGAKSKGRYAGTFGIAGCFSFYPTKNLGALGDGGAVVTSDASLAAILRSLRQYGWGEKYRVTTLGGRNSRLDELQAAFLREKLHSLDECNAQRVSIATQYRERFAKLPMRLPQWSDGEYVAHLFVVRVDDRVNFRAHLSAAGVCTDVHYPVPDYRQPALYGRECNTYLPITELACEQATTLPCFPGLTSDSIERIVTAVKRFF